MKRAIVSGLFAVLLSAGFGGFAQAQTVKLGYVDTQKLLAETPAAVQAQKALETEMAKYQAQVDSMGRSIEQQRTEFEQQQASLTAAVKQQRQAQIQQRILAFQQQVAQIDQTAQRRRAEVAAPVMRRINEVIEQVRKEGNYSLILDGGASGILAADPALDLTQTILNRLKQAAGSR